MSFISSAKNLMAGQPCRPRLFLEEAAFDIFAIGDVHGCAGLMRAMETRIFQESEQRSKKHPEDAVHTLILYLGDLVDRGPDSAGVIEQCLSPLPQGYERLCLCGNHDHMFLQFLTEPDKDSRWLDFGVRETLISYGIDVDARAVQSLSNKDFARLLKERIPDRHRQFLQSLPAALTTPQAHFVHAGMRVGVPMQEQDENDLLWIREEFLVDEPASDRLVVHGHTPGPEPREGPGRIGVDTLAVGGGPLTALHLRDAGIGYMAVTGADVIKAE